MVWKGTSFSLKNLFICVRSIYYESLWVSLSALKINDFKITPIYGILEKKIKNETLPQNFLTDKN